MTIHTSLALGIVLFDTLLKDCEESEIVAILAHELGIIQYCTFINRNSSIKVIGSTTIFLELLQYLSYICSLCFMHSHYA